MKRVAIAVVYLIMCLSWTVRPACAWHYEGHVLAADAAVLSLADELPAFFTEGLSVIRHTAIDPDSVRVRQTPQIRSTEVPEHFIDYEYVKDLELPATRYEFYTLCHDNELDPARVGTLPYAMTEWTQRLTIAFAEHRRWPEDEAIKSKILVYAGILAHYAGDAGQPLHTTIHYNGRADESGKSPRTGIHERVDDVYWWLKLDAKEVAAQVEPQQYDDLLQHVIREILASHALVDRVYELESDFPPINREESWRATESLRAFAVDRLNHSAQIIASLYLTAWRDSQTLTLPDWLDRQIDKAPSP